MLTTIGNCLEAAKRRRAEGRDDGFSLIELIIVVVILGVLVAIAIPIFGSIQTTARQNAVAAAAANGATAVAAAIANGESASDVEAAARSAGSGDIVVTIATAPAGSTDDATSICVQAASEDGSIWARSGTAAGCNDTSWGDSSDSD